MSKHLKVFLIMNISIFSFLFIGSVKAYKYQEVEIDSEFLNKGWEVLEGKKMSSIVGNSSRLLHKDDFSHSICFFQTDEGGRNLKCLFLTDISFKKQDGSAIYYNTNTTKLYSYAPAFKYYVKNNSFVASFDFGTWFSNYYPTSFDLYDSSGNQVATKDFDFPPITNYSYTINFHLNGGWLYNRSIDFGSEEDFSLSLYQNEFNDFINDSDVKKQSMIFDGWYYDESFTHPFSINDSLNSDIDLYAKFRFKVAEDFLSDSNFIEHEFDQNYLYGLINRGDNGNSVYIGLPFEVFDLEIYEYDEDSHKVKDGASVCPVPIIKKDGYYYYDLNTLYTNDQEVLILPKSYFDNLSPDNYHFYLTDNAYVHYSNDLVEGVITDSNGNEVIVNFKNSYELSRQYHDIYSNKENSFAQLKVFLAQLKKITTVFPKLAEYFYNSLNETIQNFLIYIFIIILIVTVFRIIRRS